MTPDIGYSVQQPGLWYSHPGSGLCHKEELGTLLPLGRRFQNPCAVTNSMFVRPWLPSLHPGEILLLLCGDHQQPSVVQQIKGFQVAKQV